MQSVGLAARRSRDGRRILDSLDGVENLIEPADPQAELDECAGTLAGDTWADRQRRAAPSQAHDGDCGPSRGAAPRPKKVQGHRPSSRARQPALVSPDLSDDVQEKLDGPGGIPSPQQLDRDGRDRRLELDKGDPVGFDGG